MVSQPDCKNVWSMFRNLSYVITIIFLTSKPSHFIFVFVFRICTLSKWQHNRLLHSLIGRLWSSYSLTWYVFDVLYDAFLQAANRSLSGWVWKKVFWRVLFHNDLPKFLRIKQMLFLIRFSFEATLKAGTLIY